MTAPYLPTLTLWQPMASLLAAGVKTIETRSWATKHRGRIGIASAKKQPYGGDARGPWVIAYRASVTPGRRPIRYLYNPTENRTLEMPLGVLVATAELVDCAPIGGPYDFRTGTVEGDEGDYPGQPVVVLQPALGTLPPYLCIDQPTPPYHVDITDQLPYGIWTPGRFAWLLDDVKPVTDRCPWCWGDGGFTEDSMVLYGVPGGSDWADPCPVCNPGGARSEPLGVGAYGCDPVPVRGRERLWRWTPDQVTA